MSETRISAGTRLYFTPIPNDFSKPAILALEKACGSLASIESAYLIRCSLPGEDQIRLVLIAVILSKSEHAVVARALIASTEHIRGGESRIDILPVEPAALPPSAVQIGTKVK